MGFGVTELLILLVIVALLFGTKKLRNIGSDVGGAVKGFRSAMKDGEETEKLVNDATDNEQGHVIEGQVDAEQNKNEQA